MAGREAGSGGGARVAQAVGIAGAESCCGAVEAPRRHRRRKQRRRGRGRPWGSCGDAGASDFRPRRPGAGPERGKWLWRSYSSDVLLRRKLLLRRCRQLLRQQLDVSTMDAEFKSCNMVLMIHPQFSSMFITIPQFTGLQCVFSVNLGSSNILK